MSFLDPQGTPVRGNTALIQRKSQKFCVMRPESMWQRETDKNIGGSAGQNFALSNPVKYLFQFFDIFLK